MSDLRAMNNMLGFGITELNKDTGDDELEAFMDSSIKELVNALPEFIVNMPMRELAQIVQYVQDGDEEKLNEIAEKLGIKLE